MRSRGIEPSVTVREFGPRGYREVWAAMRAFTDERTSQTLDELWLLEHDAVFTLGQAGRREHVLNPGAIPVEQSDRGGQVTYHGPGQIVAYLLLDLRRRKLGVRGLVWALEQAVIELLAETPVRAVRKSGAPGVYVDGAKVAALGVRIRRGCSYHGLALNVDMDLEPFERIDPCGFPGLQVTQLRDLGIEWDAAETRQRLVGALAEALEQAPRIEAATKPRNFTAEDAENAENAE